MSQETIDDINEIIELLGKDARKIPESITDFFRRNASKPRIRRIDLEKGLKNQNFSSETCALIKYISLYLK